MLVQRPFPASFDEMCRFHSEEYITFLKTANPDNLKLYNKQMLKCEFLKTSELLLALKLRHNQRYI